MDELFERLRSGAANVAGVTYQINLATLLLVSGRSEDLALPTVALVRPEGFEDIDCQLDDGRWLLVQSKQRSSGAMSRAQVAAAIVHAGQVESARDYDDMVDGYAIVSNRGFAIGATGWTSTLAGDDVELTEAVNAQLRRASRDPAVAEDLIKRTRLVIVDDSLVGQIESSLMQEYKVPPTVAVLARSRLATEMAALSSAQRGREVATAHACTVSEVDAMVSRLQETVDVAGMEEALRSGVCEFAEFASGTADTVDQFFSGVRVVPSHIGANHDVVRVPECESILEALAESNHVLIVGPSGTGKSGLLWRTAFMVQAGPMLLRLLRVETEQDAQSLLRYVRALSPNAGRRVLVCVDDVGRASMELWPEVRDRLLEMPGVSVLGACRQEDLLPSISIGARMVDSHLTAGSAARIYAQMEGVGLELRTEPEEAIQRADGLLMEFIAISTTGQRLREVLRGQMQRVADEQDTITWDLLGVITALHTLGRPVAAEALPVLIGELPLAISHRLSRLQAEHLVMTEDGTSWRALHDLRAEVLLEILHETPPPTLAATYARSIRAVPPVAQPALFRRAATRVLRAARLGNIASVPDRLATAHRVIEPLVRAIGDHVGLLSDQASEIPAADVAAFVDAAERLDVAAYAAATLDLVQQATPPALDVSNFYLLVYSSKFSSVFDGSDMFKRIVAIGNELPEWESIARRAVVARIPDEVVNRVLAESDLAMAVRFGERLEGYRSISPSDAASVYEAHRVHGTEQPSLEVADLIAQLVATLTSLAKLRGAEVAHAFGSVEARATWAVEADEAGFHAEVAYADRSELPQSSGSLARQSTYSASAFCEVSARAFARLSTDTAQRGYPPRLNEDPMSTNSQAVFLAQRLFDACPEADVVSVQLVPPHVSGEQPPPLVDGEKRMRAGVVPRRISTERSVAIQVAVSELLSAERWSDRCRSQAAANAELVSLLEALPAQLADRVSFRGRREWIGRVNSAAMLVARLPGLPIDSQLVESLNTELPLASDFDQKLRESMRDPSKDALDLIAGCLAQVASGLDDESSLRGAGFRLKGAVKALGTAREGGKLPEFAGVGCLLSVELEGLSAMASRLLVARGTGKLSPEAVRGKSLAEVDMITTETARLAAAKSRSALEHVLERVGIDAVLAKVGPITDPPDPLLHLRLAVAVESGSWADAVEGLQSWNAKDRAAAGFGTRTTVVATVEGRVVQAGVVLDGTSAGLQPGDSAEVQDAASLLGLPLAVSKHQQRARELVARLAAKSLANLLSRRRPVSWRAINPVAVPEVTAAPSDPQAWREVLEVYSDLRDSVIREGADSGAFVAALAAVDLADAESAPSPVVLDVGRLQSLAIVADLQLES